MDGAHLPATVAADSGAGRLTIDLSAIAANYATLCRIHRGPVGAVVKADAYGLGMVPVAATLHAAGCDDFFVAHVAEGVALRATLPTVRIYVLHGIARGTEPACVEHALTPVLASMDQVARWTPWRRAAMLHADTGLHRLGLEPADIAALAADPPAFEVTHVLSHLISADCADDPDNARQLAAFRRVCAKFPASHTSLANSAGIFLGAEFASDLARPGAALYGCNPTLGQPNPMRPVVTLTAPVLQVRDVPTGGAVGYNATWRAEKPSRVATAAVGYADGFLRAQSNRGIALFDGRPVPLIGRVSMDLATFDVTGEAVAPGHDLTLIGVGRTVEDVADAAGTNPYEILCALGARYSRRYQSA